MDYYNTVVPKIEAMDATYVRFGQPQEHVSAPAHYGNNIPSGQFRHPIQYQPRGHFKQHSPYEEFEDGSSQYVTVQYEGNGAFKNEVHYPSKFQSGFPIKNSENPKNLSHSANGRNYVAAKTPRPATQGSWQTGNFKEMRGSTVNYGASNIGFKGQKAGATTIQNTLASFAYEDKVSSGLNKIGGGPAQKVKTAAHSNNFSPTKPVSILKNPNSQSYSTASNGLFESTKASLKTSIQHSFVEPGFTPAHKYQNMSSVDNAAKMENGQQKYPWKYTADGAIRKKRKPTPTERNMRFKKIVRPKNAVMCLNELVQSAVFQTEQESNAPGIPHIVYVEVDGQKYRGYGSSKQLAKQAAAEAALVSFVKPVAASNNETEEDPTPWTTLASFAMFKLFNEWREGRIGAYPPNNPPSASVMQDNTISQTLQMILNNQGHNVPLPPTTNQIGDLPTPLVPMMEKKNSGGPKQIPNPAKQVPPNAAATHPVMLLHQMRPNIIYNQSAVTRDNQQLFCVQAQIDGVPFVGEGLNVKKAKYDLALKANQTLFGVVSTFTGNK